MEKRILTEEQRKLLAGYMPFNCKNTINFTPSLLEELDISIRPVFKLRSLNNEEQKQLKILSSEYFKNIEGLKYEDEEYLKHLKKITEGTEEVIRKCIVGFSNIFDVGSGEEIVEEFEHNENFIKKYQYDLFPEWIKVEITKYVRKISQLSQQEKLSLK